MPVASIIVDEAVSENLCVALGGAGALLGRRAAVALLSRGVITCSAPVLRGRRAILSVAPSYQQS